MTTFNNAQLSFLYKVQSLTTLMCLIDYVKPELLESLGLQHIIDVVGDNWSYTDFDSLNAELIQFCAGCEWTNAVELSNEIDSNRIKAMKLCAKEIERADNIDKVLNMEMEFDTLF